MTQTAHGKTASGSAMAIWARVKHVVKQHCHMPARYPRILQVAPWLRCLSDITIGKLLQFCLCTKRYRSRTWTCLYSANAIAQTYAHANVRFGIDLFTTELEWKQNKKGKIMNNEQEIFVIKTRKKINVPVLGLHILVRLGGEARSLIQKLDPDYPWNRKSATKMRMCRMHYARFWSSFPPRLWCCSSSSTKNNSRSSSNNSSMRSRRSRRSSSRRSRNERKTVRPNPGAIFMFQSFKALNLMAYLQYYINISTRYNNCRNVSIKRTSRGPCKYIQYILHSYSS